MRAHRLSVSKLSLAHQCLYGFRMDAAQSPRPPGENAQIGSATHLLTEERVKGKPAVLHGDLTIRAKAQAIFDGPLTGFLDTRQWTACEIGLHYDAANDKAVAGPRRGEDGYADVGPMTLPGTLDLVEVVGDEACLYDLKTGKPPEDSEQLYGQAVAVSRFYGVKKVTVAYARALKTKLEILRQETLDEDRLDYEAGRIVRLLRRLPVAEPKMSKEACWRCDARPQCPAQLELQQAELVAIGALA